MDINLQQSYNEEQCLNKDLNIFPDGVIEKFMALLIFFIHVGHVFNPLNTELNPICQ